MKHLLLIAVSLVALITSCKKNKDASLATLTTTAITNLTATTAQTGGSITSDGGATITKSGVCWATHTNPTVGDSITTDVAGASLFVSNLLGLSSNTTYYVKAYAINAAGTGYGNEISFVTSKGLPNVTTTAISSIVPLSASSGGNVISDGGYTITARGVVWSTTVHPTISNNKTTDGTTTGSYNSTLTPLASQTVYYVRAYATTSFGTGYGNELSFTSSSSNSFADIDGNVYTYITIGTQTWMTSNLKTTRYRNGDSITNGLTGFDFTTATTGAYSFPNKDSTNNSIYGKLYNWWAVNDSRNIAPVGWHVPSDDEWKTLEKNQGMTQADADLTGYRGTIGALFLEGGASGLNFQKAGSISTSTNAIAKFGVSAYYLSSTVVGTAPNVYNWNRVFNLNSSGPGPIYRNYGGGVYSVRCVKD